MAKKKKLSTSFMIGMFVLSGLVLLVGFLMWMGATQFFKEYDYYVTYFEDSVTGLENGSSVKYLGVPCGIVSDIQIAPDGKLVEIVIKLDKGLKIDEDFIVKLEMAGIAGGKFLQLYSAKGAIVNNFNLDFEIPYPLLNSAPSQLDEIAQSAESIISDLKRFKWQEISEGLSGTLEGTNKIANDKDIILMISDLREITNSLKEISTNLAKTNIVGNLEATTVSLSNSATSIEKFAGNLNNKLDEINLPNYMDKYYLGFESTINTANSTIEAVSTRFQSSFLGINMLIDDLTQTNKNLKKTLQNINDSPYLFLTEPPPKENIKVKTKK